MRLEMAIHHRRARRRLPIAATLLGIEFFGIAHALPLALASLLATHFSAKSAIT